MGSQGGLSLKPRGRFCSFSASILVWWSLIDLPKMITFRRILDLLEGFFITMATDVDFSENDPEVVKPRVIPFDSMYDSPRSVETPASFQKKISLFKYRFDRGDRKIFGVKYP